MREVATVCLLALGIAPWATLRAQDAQQQAWTVLNKSLQSKDADHRRQAIGALSAVEGNAQAVKMAMGGLDDKEMLVRASAALALGEMKAEQAIPALTKALTDKGEVAFAAAKSLAEMGDSNGRDMLITVLAGERKDIKPGLMANAISKGKAELHDPGKLAFMGAQDATEAVFGPAGYVFPVVRDTLDLKSKGAPQRAAAAAYLARDPDPYAITLLEWALNDPNEFVRLAAAKGLGQRGNADSIGKLQLLLDDPHNIVRDVAAASILRIGDRNGAAGEPSEGPVKPVVSKSQLNKQ